MNFKYYLLYPFIWPFMMLDKAVFFEIDGTRIWDDSIWLHRILIWHDSLFNYSDWEEFEEVYKDEEEIITVEGAYSGRHSHIID